MLEYRQGLVSIHPGYEKLITALMLDIEATSHDDLFDAFRMSLQFWH